jgi:Protein of unknown function (DUF4054)
MSSGPNIDGLLCGWFGGDSLSLCGCPPNFTLAANLFFGGNPPYQVDDFLAFYPKFATQPQGIVSAVPNATTPGAGYAVNDVLTVVQTDASGGQIKVTAVTGGVPTTYAVIVAPGTGYLVAQKLATTGGSGTGALVDITGITTASGFTPQPVIQLFINLASASLQQARWKDSWLYAMHLFVAHYCTLWLSSEGNPVSTAGQAAVSGLGKGIAVSKAAGDVSVGYEPMVDMEWTALNLTVYGQQLVQMAKIVGMGAMYIG